MDVAEISMNLSQNKLMSAVGTSMLSKSLDLIEGQVTMLTEGMDMNSPAQVEGTQGFLPQHGKALERPSSMGKLHHPQLAPKRPQVSPDNHCLSPPDLPAERPATEWTGRESQTSVRC